MHETARERILVVEDTASVLVAIQDSLADLDYEVAVARTGTEGLEQARALRPDLIIADVRLPGTDGISLLRTLRAEGLDAEFILITAFATVESAVEALKLGAHDYLTKPFPMEKLLHTVGNALRTRRVEQQHETLKERLTELVGAEDIIGTSAPMLKLADLIRTVAPTDSTVLITGESGTGKELVARAVQANSRRGNRRYIKVHSASLPKTLIETELFGHEKGAFTGAVKQVKGRFELADGGTLLLDEIDELPLETQVKLLRVIQEREIERVGGRTLIGVDVRLIATSKADLATLVASGEFRKDLYYRLNVVNLHLPPLRERLGDVPLLVDHFIRLLRPKLLHPIQGFTPAAMELLCAYRYPGNVRELAHAVESAVILSAGAPLVDVAQLPEPIRATDPTAHCLPSACVPFDLPLADALRSFERSYLAQVLEAHAGTRTDLAARLGISRKNLWEKLKAHGLE